MSVGAWDAMLQHEKDERERAAGISSVAGLAALRAGARRAGLLPGQVPDRENRDHGPDWSDHGIDHPEEGPSCKCGYNGTPEECATDREIGSHAHDCSEHDTWPCSAVNAARTNREVGSAEA